jgi:Zn-dependent M28 family amino/carboxypeptidase
MDFARHFAQNPAEYTTVFLLFSGEESGLRGSRYFVENPLIDLSKVKLVLNLDMFCGGDEGFTVVNSDGENTKWFYDNLVRINDEQHLVSQVKPRSNAANSDHYFFSLKCPAIFIYTMGGRYGGYHHFTDTCESCGLENYNRIFSLILQALELDK